MPIKPSRTADVRALIAALASNDEVQVESAVARLAVIGGRAVDRLSAAYSAAPREMRVAILRALEAIADPRAVVVARTALGEGGGVAVAAAASLRPLLESTDSHTATAALDALVERALDPSAERRVRLAAFDALRDLPASVRDRVAAALEQQAGRVLPPTSSDTAGDAVWEEAVDGRLPDDPAGLRNAVETRAGRAPLGVLQKLIDALRAQERHTETPARRNSWLGVRGALHQALALRGSRIALYDLRETVADGRLPLPASFLAALHAVGDESCLEPIAAAWTSATLPPVPASATPTVQRSATRPNDGSAVRWRQQLAAAFQAIVTRERISTRGAVWKRLVPRYPEAVRAFSPAPRTTPRRKTRGVRT